MNNLHRLIFVSLLFSAAFCLVAKPARKVEVPLWISDEGQLSLFPRDEFLSAMASGKSAEIAKQNAASEIAKSIRAKVNSQSIAEQHIAIVNGEHSNSQSIFRSVEILSDGNLYGLEFTQTFFSEKENLFYCAAFIHKQKAWTLVEPVLKNISAKIHLAKKSADEADDYFSKTVFLVSAKDRREEFLSAYSFALAVNENAAKEFNAVLNTILFCENEIAKNKSRNTVFVRAQNYIEESVFQKMCDIFDANGFSPVKIASNARFTANATCDVHIKPDGEIFSCYPGISLEVKENATGKIVYAFSESAKRTAGKDYSAAQKNAHREIRNILENKFLKQGESL